MQFPMSPWGMDHIFIPVLQQGALRMASEDSHTSSSCPISASVRLRFPPLFMGLRSSTILLRPAGDRWSPDWTSAVIVSNTARSSSFAPLSGNRSKNGKNPFQ